MLDAQAYSTIWGTSVTAWKRDYERDEEVWSSNIIWGSGKNASRCADEP